jgi:hypothetical protein
VRKQLGRAESRWKDEINPLNAELIIICHLLALLGAHHNLHVSSIRVKISLKEIRWKGMN